MINITPVSSFTHYHKRVILRLKIIFGLGWQSRYPVKNFSSVKTAFLTLQNIANEKKNTKNDFKVAAREAEI